MPKSGSNVAGNTRAFRCALVVAALTLALAAPTAAQVVFDGSLGAPGPAPSAPGIDYLIEQGRGELVGANLFQSFSQFSIPEGTRAEFTAVDAVDNVIARVTGPSVSRIGGTLASSIPGADLYLLNPNGVVFGQQAQLDLPASLHVASADSLRFTDGSTLVVQDGDAPILSASPPAAFGFLPGPTGDVLFPLENPAVDTELIVVAPGETFSAVGGDVLIDSRVSVLTQGGSIQLAAVGDAGSEVPVEVGDFTARGVEGLGQVRVGDNVTLDALDLVALDAPQGRIVIRGESLAVERGFLFAGGDGAPGSAAIDAEVNGTLVIDGGSAVQAFTAGTPAGGDVLLTAGEVVVSDLSLAGAQSFGSGPGGAVRVTTRALEIANGSRLVSESFGTGGSGALAIDVMSSVEVRQLSEIATRAENGPGGALTIESETLVASTGGQISTTTNGSGPAGALSVVTSGDVTLIGTSEPSGTPSGLFARSGSGPGSGATGDGGPLTVSAGNLTVSEGAFISARTFGSGDAGDVTIVATGDVTVGERSAISVTAQEGDGGSLSVTAATVAVENGGQILASTEGTGDSGDISIRADSVNVSGRSPVGARSAITAITTLDPASGTGGDAGVIEIEAGDVVVADGGLVTTRSLGAGQPNRIEIRTRGDLEIDGGELRSVAESPTTAVTGGDIVLESQGDTRLTNDALVTAQALGAGDAGNIVMLSQGRLDLKDAQVTTEARVALGGNILLDGGRRLTLTRSEVATSVQEGDGTGGDIDLGRRQVSLNASTVLARAFEGEGGNIRVEASDAYVQSSDSVVDATATTDLGIDGTFVVDAPEADLASDLARLPETFLDASQQLQRDCEIRTERAGSFVVRGTAPPPPPDDLLLPEPLATTPGAPPCDPR